MVKGLKKWTQTLVNNKKSKEKGLVIDGKQSSVKITDDLHLLITKYLEPYTFHL